VFLEECRLKVAKRESVNDVITAHHFRPQPTDDTSRRTQQQCNNASSELPCSGPHRLQADTSAGSGSSSGSSVHRAQPASDQLRSKVFKVDRSEELVTSNLHPTRGANKCRGGGVTPNAITSHQNVNKSDLRNAMELRRESSIQPLSPPECSYISTVQSLYTPHAPPSMSEQLYYPRHHPTVNPMSMSNHGALVQSGGSAESSLYNPVSAGLRLCHMGQQLVAAGGGVQSHAAAACALKSSMTTNPYGLTSFGEGLTSRGQHDSRGAYIGSSQGFNLATPLHLRFPNT